MPIKNRIAELQGEITEWRRHLHQNPELVFDTHETAAFVVEKLKAFGIDDITTGIGRTGVVAVIKGKTDSSGKTIGLRADMDALPILEETGLPYKSKVDGKMHACGHDGHTAMLLGAAKYLAETRNFDGTCIVIFQPAEEGGGGGKEMVDDGLMDRWEIDEVYGMHNWPGIAVGEFAIRPGPFFASTDQFVINIEGKGGHAAMPHMTVDSTVVASHLVVALQTIASRSVSAVDQVVVSVTSFETGAKVHNVIPQKVTLRGTVRTLDADVRNLAERRLGEISVSVAQAFGAIAAVDYQRFYPVVVNPQEQTEFAAAVASKISGDCAVAPLVMGGEDFSYMLNERPGAYMLAGNGDTAMLHSPHYNFDDEVIPAGCSYLAEIIETGMPAA